MSMPSQPVDSHYIAQTLRLAKKGLGHTVPNPMVGAVIVKNGTEIGSGYHHKAGQAHAEIEALHSIKQSARGATLYVNLEPCSHHGKTPPCVDATIAAGISRVVCATLDPNPLVSGNGVARLRAAGINVSVGILSEEARLLNEAFFVFHEQHRPFVAIKFAVSLDGKIATSAHDSKWITSERARRYSRTLRSQYQAILVGSNTVIDDDPHLGSRLAGKTDPLRVILDRRLRIPLTSQVFRDTNVLVVTSQQANAAKRKKFLDKGISLCISPDTSTVIPAVLKELARREVISVLVEGGGTVLGSFVDSGLVDKVYAFYGPLLIGGKKAVGAIGGQGATTVEESLHIQDMHYKKFGDSILISGSVHT